MIFRLSIFLFFALFFVGCFGNAPQSIAGNQKAFEDEDKYILFALHAEELKEYNASSSIYNTLYEHSGKKEYLHKSVQNTLLAKEYESVIQRVDSINDVNDFTLLRMKVFALINLDKLEDAKTFAMDLAKKSKEVDDYLLLSNIYVKQKKYDTAVKYLEKAYVQNYNEKILDKMSIILYINLQRKKDAIAQLETHTRVHGCSNMICSRLIGFYSNENNVDGLLSIYLRMYENNKNEQIAQKIVQIYQYKQEIIKLISFLELSKIDNDLLLQLYIGMKNYKKASQLAKSLYAKTSELHYLGQSAIYEYEGSKNKSDKAMLKRVTKKLKKVADAKTDVLYLNYYGYLLIDHNLNVKEGMRYINKALRMHPNSAFYLDSLAWGYYKLGNCTKAESIMNKVIKLQDGDNEEVVAHMKIIKKCMKLQKKMKER